MVLLYLAVIVVANLSVAHFGPAVSVVNAFLLVSFDLTARDALHDRWKNEGLVAKMALLIITGSLLTVALNWGAWRIAVSSTAAFFCAAIVDSVVYHVLGEQGRIVRVNGSNVFSAAVDSLVFPILAFGFPIMWSICAGQFLAKVLGGFLWALAVRWGSSSE